MSIKYSKESRIFRDFRCIPYADYFYMIRFFEQYYAEFNHLTFDEEMIITYYYAVALYETESYYSFLKVADQLIEDSIVNNIQFVDGQDIYMNLLSNKACAMLQLEKVVQAQQLAEQIVRIAPHDNNYTQLLYHCTKAKRPASARNMLLFSAAAVFTDSIFIIVQTSFYTELSFAASVVHYILLLLAFVGLCFSAACHFKQVSSPTRQFVQKARQDKRQSRI